MAKEVSGVALVVAQEVPTSSSTMAVPHGPAGVGTARRQMRAELRAYGAPEGLVDDAVLILSELLSNACRHARPLRAGTAEETEEYVRAAWSCAPGGELTIAVTDGGGPTRPMPSKPSVTARGGRGLAIITSLARDWGVDEHLNVAARRAPRTDGVLGARPAGVTVWAVLSAGGEGFGGALAGLDLTDLDEELGELGGLGTA
ncbi:ATP-binding protein [Streptomyces sp. RKND-216]|uniref:ATP-binding protein n=1 Tax=Streptomyces sp. RKND-216 TaxID=2562581 RepID=UPI001B3497F0|nr:ATP-binding protein [Streptomyces sp. RKND-216]